MNSVPNRAGAHRALTTVHTSMYMQMGDKQLKAVHEQAKANPQIEKYASRLPHTTAEMKRRGL